MKTIVFIGSNQFGTSKEALSIAKEIGYSVVLITNKFQQINALKFPEVDHLVFLENIFDKGKVLKEINEFKNKGRQICACISFIDPYVSYAAEIAMNLGLFSISIEAFSILENKIKVRHKLKDLPYSPFYTVLSPGTSINEFVKEHQSKLPLILKIPNSNGSKNVLFVDTVHDLKRGITSLQKKFQKLPILIEEYLIGPQYLIEIVVHDGVIQWAGVIEQEIIKDKTFIVTGYNFPALLDDERYDALINCVEEIIKELGLTNGSCHLEMKQVEGEWKLVEINPRMSGGAMNRIIEEGTGINLVKEIVKMNLGQTPVFLQTRHQHVYAKYITISRSGYLLQVTGEEHARKHSGVKYVYVKPVKGKIITVPYSMGNRYACVIAASESPKQAKETALAAAKKIKFYLEPFS
ncbi:ATP-grasp domain-containing protein [Bacillus sp. S/N-304-OC-R1]|uniref:ATP-grasp domain-containing protein n=1 Tax=Bacillus sp. S/N-304-OC-R1 TaxID=2758034 RepID=UPI001C8CFD26|nr:ATP-grasp domain-containing protein [Bacillus sp. S/N-304-OC-R1]MBY0121270.1 ATP-grasp domain-containing protein [Bacillus sp. S/N-304-OC-R1]